MTAEPNPVALFIHAGTCSHDDDGDDERLRLVGMKAQSRTE
jgi:hypothetical protein